MMQAETNYIYILFAVAYAIYSIVKAGKKITKNRPTTSSNPIPQEEQSYTSQKKEEFKPVQPPTSAPVPQHNPGEDLRKMLEDLMGGTRDRQDEPTPTFTQETKIPQVKVSKPNPQYSSSKSQHRQSEHGSHQVEHPQIISHPLEKSKSEPVGSLQAKPIKASPKIITEPVAEEQVEADFDFRQAIIFSEILKRPQY